jgi:hypothetical protein
MPVEVVDVARCGQGFFCLLVLLFRKGLVERFSFHRAFMFVRHEVASFSSSPSPTGSGLIPEGAPTQTVRFVLCNELAAALCALSATPAAGTVLTLNLEAIEEY